MRRLKIINSPDGFYEPFNQSSWVLIVGIILLIVASLVFVFATFQIVLSIRRSIIKKNKATPKLEKNINAVYCDKLDKILQAFVDKKINEKDFYYEIAKNLKEFAAKKTKINTHNLTLAEIDKNVKLHLLAVAIQEIYFFEFANVSAGKNIENYQNVVNSGKSMIGQWGS